VLAVVFVPFFVARCCLRAGRDAVLELLRVLTAATFLRERAALLALALVFERLDTVFVVVLVFFAVAFGFLALTLTVAFLAVEIFRALVLLARVADFALPLLVLFATDFGLDLVLVFAFGAAAIVWSTTFAPDTAFWSDSTACLHARLVEYVGLLTSSLPFCASRT